LLKIRGALPSYSQLREGEDFPKVLKPGAEDRWKKLEAVDVAGGAMAAACRGLGG
jgi:hypothetical protein